MAQPQEEQYLYLTTVGRHSGQPREIEIWFTHLRGRYYVIAEYATAQWVQNIRANPAVRVRVRDSIFEATARVIEASAEPELHAQVRLLSEKKYGWGEGLIVELSPQKDKAPQSGATKRD